MNLCKVRFFKIYISSSSNNLSATERKLSKQSLIGPIRANPDLGSI